MNTLIIKTILCLSLSYVISVAQAQTSIEDSLILQGKRLTKKGYYEKALETFRTLLESQQKRNTTKTIELAQTYTLLGRVSLRKQNKETALHYFREALKLQQIRYGLHSTHNLFLYFNLIATYQELNKYKLALLYTKKALRSKPQGSYYLYSALGTNYFQLARYDSSLYYYQKAIKFKATSGALQNIGNTYLKLGKVKKAIRYYEQAQQSSLPFYTQISLWYKLSKAWYFRAQQVKGVESSTKYWALKKALVTVSTADSLIKARQLSLQTEKDQLVLGQWVQAITELGLMISYQLYQQASDNTRIRWQALVFYFGERQKSSVLLNQLRGKTNPKTIDLSTLQRQLNATTAVLTYSFGKHTLYAFAITQKQISLKALPRDSVDKHWRYYGFYLHTLNVTKCVKYTHQMYKWLIEPLYPSIKNKKRWLVVAGILNILPFDTFCRYRGVNTQKVAPLDINYQSFPFLIWRHTISYAPSVTLAFFKVAKYSYTQQFLGVAPGTYQAAEQYATLKHAPQEIARIAAMLPNTKQQVLLGKKATRKQVLNLAKQARWLHFATHGVSHHQAELNGILLYDGKWLVKDLENLHLQNDLVVMSSCSAIAGKFSKGEGRLAMPRSFLRAGAQHIVYTLWSVNDQLAARFMTSFYKYILKGQPYAEALRKAKLEFLSDSKPIYGYPGLWGVFLLEGRF